MLSKNVERWIEEWKAEGEARGKAEGEAKGRSIGEAEAIQKVARNMLQKGMSSDQIAEVTGLSEQAIQTLRDSITH